MAINLNINIVTKAGLLKFIDDISVYRFYTGEEVELKVIKNSPLREDNNPSFGYFVGESGEICFKDWLIGAGDFVKFVQLKFKLNYYEALSKIAIDFGLEEHFIVRSVEKSVGVYNPNLFKNKEDILNNNKPLELGKKQRNWAAHDYAFWLQYGIDEATLLKYRVQPIEYIFVNGNPIYVHKYAYAFIEHKDGKETYKIYQPYNTDFKWLNNHNDSIWQGWEQLPEKGETLIITKSLKDVMSIVNNTTDIAAVALQSESVHPKDYIIQELKDRFENIFLLYDNDFDKDINWGRQFGQSLASTFDLLQIEIHQVHKSKDFSDLIKNLGKKRATTILESMIACPF
jgi:hypothetical protein